MLHSRVQILHTEGQTLFEDSDITLSGHKWPTR